MPTTTSSLPLEILDQVCEYIALDYPQGVYDVVLVNRHWYASAGKYRYQHIHINIVNRLRLAQDISYWNRILRRVSGFVSVRQLTVRGQMPPRARDHGCTSYLDEWAYDGHGPEDELTRLDHVYNQSIADLFDRTSNYEIVGWRPLVDLLKHLTGLHSLIWACQNPIPPRVLRVLQQDIRNCRLNHRTFKLPSLHQYVGNLHDIDQHDYALATSKYLTSILVPLTHYDAEGCVEYNQEAVRQMAAGLAPNLTHVHIVYRYCGRKIPDVVRRGRPRWKGFFIKDAENTDDEEVEVPPSIHLQAWSLSPASLTYFTEWEAYIAFSELHILQLWAVSVETLIEARTLQLNSLKTLALDLEYPGDRYGDFDRTKALRLDGAAGNFLSGMAVSLQSIHLSGIPICERAFQAVIDHHGKTLHTLSLVSPGSCSPAGVQATPNRIRKIQKHCPNIRDLRLPIRRTKGDSREVDIYKAFGVFSNLTDLLLQLDMTNGLPPPPFERPSTTAQWVLDTFINAAVDETLVRTMIHKIVRAGAHSLQRFKVISNLEVTHPVELVNIVHVMARKWKCTRFPAIKDKDAEPCEAKVVVEELGAKARMFRNTLSHAEDRVRLDPYEPLFRQLWPDRILDRYWDDEWQSFPLS